MNTFEERYGVEEGEAVKHYHRIRRMFCIKDDVLYIAKPNVEYSHAVWFEMNGWSDDVMNTAVRGVVDPHGNIYYYVGYDFQNNQTVDDVAFVENLVDSLQAMHSLSEQDVFCTGMSNGGDFSYMLACQASETFKAVAPVAGMIMQEIMDNCNPVNEVSILEVHGTQDNVTYWQGDPNNNDGWGAYPSIPNTISFFTHLTPFMLFMLFHNLF